MLLKFVHISIEVMLLITFTVKFNIKRIDMEVHFVVYNMFKLMILQQLLSLSLYEDFGTCAYMGSY